MADPVRVRVRDRLGTRLAVAFIATGLGAVALLTIVALLGSGTAVAGLAAEQRAATATDVAGTVATAYERAGGWDGADLLPAHTLAAAAGAVLTVTSSDVGELPAPPGVDETRRRIGRGAPHHDGDHGGHQRPQSQGPSVPLPATSGAGAPAAFGAFPADTEAQAAEDRIEAPVEVDGQRIATVALLFVEREGLDPADGLQALLTRNVLLGAAAAALLALVVTALVTPQLTRPVRRLVGAVDRLRRGDGERPESLPEAPGELGVLAAAVDGLAADLERQEQLRQGLVADVAHELRTPLTILLGEVEALRDGLVAPDGPRLASLHEEVQRLARLVEDVDTLADAGAAGFGLRAAPVDLAAVGREALAGIEQQPTDAGVHFATDLHHVEIEGDHRRLEQVVRNLLSNAVKFSPAGARVTVRVRAEHDGGVLKVCDEGPGIPAGELPQVFDRFWRGSQAEGVGGSGIGLAVVREIVAAHGGRVHAENRASGGLCVTVHLPGTQRS
jgi:two-component system, OmpR family, sensor histidine kinase BaeS